jgi:hypothetical protein
MGRFLFNNLRTRCAAIALPSGIDPTAAGGDRFAVSEEETSDFKEARHT